MRIEKLHIQNFGKIHDRTLELSEGLNVFFGKNESGKTTFYHFLKGMLYGLGRKRGRGAGNDAYSHYEPWDNPADYGGTLWFYEAGDRYRLGRRFFKDAPAVELYCTSASRRLEPEQLETLLGGVSEAVYENTVSVGQLKSVTGPDLTRELTNYMAACQGAADSRINVEKAIQFLKMNRKGYTDQSERMSRQTTQELEKLSAQIDLVKKELEEAKNRVREAEAVLAEASGAEKTHGAGPRLALEKKSRVLVEYRRRSGLYILLGGVVAAAGLLLEIICLMLGLPFFPMGVLGLAALAAGAFTCLVSGIRLKQITDRQQRIQKKISRYAVRKKKKKNHLKELNWRKETLKEAVLQKQETLENLQEEYKDYEYSEELVHPQEEQIEAIDLAMERIHRTSAQIRRNLGVRLRERTSQILCEITEGKYQEILVDDSLKLSVNTDERIVELERLSRGTVEQIYFALRMASGELLCGKKIFPVILDDVFGMYDDERLSGVLKWLMRQNRQVILFTCSGREAGILEQLGAQYKSFEM